MLAMTGRLTDEELRALEDEARDLLGKMDGLRDSLAETRARRKVVLQTMVKAIGAKQTADRLGVTRQAIYAAMR